MTETRRAGDRTHVRMIYGMAVGGFLIAAGVIVLIYGLTNDLINNPPVYFLGGGLCLCGLVAGAPHTWMPVLGALLKKIPWGNVNGADLKPTPTLTVPKLSDDESDD